MDKNNKKWNIVGRWLKENKKMYTNVLVNNIPAVSFAINPLLKRFKNGERTKKLYKEIMLLG